MMSFLSVLPLLGVDRCPRDSLYIHRLRSAWCKWLSKSWELTTLLQTQRVRNACERSAYSDPAASRELSAMNRYGPRNSVTRTRSSSARWLGVSGPDQEVGHCPAWLAMAALPGPEQTKSLTMPSHDRFRFDDYKCTSPCRRSSQ